MTCVDLPVVLAADANPKKRSINAAESCILDLNEKKKIRKLVKLDKSRRRRRRRTG